MAQWKQPGRMNYMIELILNAHLLPIVSVFSIYKAPRDRVYEQFVIKTAQELIYINDFPRASVKIGFQLLSNDGGILATVINALNLALIDCGIPINAAIAAVTCMINRDGEFMLDPSNLEIQMATSVHTFAFDSKGGLVNAYSTGTYSHEEVFKFHLVYKLLASILYCYQVHSCICTSCNCQEVC